MTWADMQIDSAHLRYAASAAAAPAPRGAVPAVAEAPAAASPVDRVELDIPPAPPPDVLEAIAAAAERVHQLAKENRELHFRPDEHSSRIIIEVRDMSGNVIRTIPPSKALELMTASPGREGTWVA